MSREKQYQIGDYVRYEGDYSIASEPLHSADKGKIEEFHEFFDKERISLFLLNKQQAIWCDYDKIRPIYVQAETLEKIGFTETKNNERKRFQLEGIIISECAITFPHQNFLVKSGFCVGDFTNGINSIEKYLINGEFSLSLFHSDFPSVHNINDLFQFLKENEIHIDERNVVCS